MLIAMLRVAVESGRSAGSARAGGGVQKVEVRVEGVGRVLRVSGDILNS